MPSSPIATAADYADAMMSARRAKNILFLMLLVVILAQVAIFIGLRQSKSLFDQATGAPTATTQPLLSQSTAVRTLEYATAICDFMGIVLVIVLSLVLLVLTMIMLVGRLIGVSKVTSAFISCLLLMVLLFPWQSVMMSPLSGGAPETNFKVPGVLYTWGEVTHPTYGAKFDGSRATTFAILRWARFVGWPAVALVLLLMVQSKSSRGLRLALGEVEFDVAEGMPGV
jgi:hypothetical protein